MPRTVAILAASDLFLLLLHQPRSSTWQVPAAAEQGGEGAGVWNPLAVPWRTPLLGPACPSGWAARCAQKGWCGETPARSLH